MIYDIDRPKVTFEDWYTGGCQCSTQGAPCTWCLSLTELEIDILDSKGAQSVNRYRKLLQLGYGRTEAYSEVIEEESDST